MKEDELPNTTRNYVTIDLHEITYLKTLRLQNVSKLTKLESLFFYFL
jgi:hypothetical protein